jgi:hypothetical protein
VQIGGKRGIKTGEGGGGVWLFGGNSSENKGEMIVAYLIALKYVGLCRGLLMTLLVLFFFPAIFRCCPFWINPLPTMSSSSSFPHLQCME